MTIKCDFEIPDKDRLIEKIGVEIEAGWDKEFMERNSQGTFYTHWDKLGLKNTWKAKIDNSLKTKKEVGWGQSAEVTLAEVVTYPPARTVDSIIHDMEKLWTEINDVNESMGFHIHISFGVLNRKIMNVLCSWEFVDTFQRYVIEEFPETELRYYNPYSLPYFGRRSFENQVLIDRNKAVSFVSFHRTRTIEFRIFPMNFDPSLNVSYLLFVRDFISDFLKMVKSGEILIADNNFPHATTLFEERAFGLKCKCNLCNTKRQVALKIKEEDKDLSILFLKARE